MSTEAAFQLSEQTIRSGRLFEEVLVATFSVLVAEYFQTLEDEVRFIWTSKMSFAKMVFIANRYIPLINVTFAIYTFFLAKEVTPKVCYNEYVASAAIGLFQLQLAYVVICLRAYAVWNFAWTAKGILLVSIVHEVQSTVFQANISSQGYFSGKFLASKIVLTSGASGTKHCVIDTSANGSIWVLMLTVVLADLVPLSMLLMKSFEDFRSSPVNTSLLAVMARDGIAYFSFVFALSLGNLLVLVIPNPLYKETFAFPQTAFQNALCVRLLLHLRTVNEEYEPAMETISALQQDVNNSAGDSTISAA
ncbi:hypothetical protein SCHPADRAFT_927895 [Schizopora paradoxa]|uniref:DUF6533 domain-containing protein n=1 Tax=Schizopora paradoxa TaxID=27342 RepID=A0A0H2SBV8_9AGAM|nr:hypothetical protein SCHPADRAFT_927895 [Schizopora paradoxa]